MRNKPITEETRRKMSLARMGVSPWNKGLTGFSHTEESRRKMSLARKGLPFSGIKCDWNNPIRIHFLLYGTDAC